MIIGVDCGGTYIKAGLVDGKNIIKEITAKTEAKRGKSKSISNLLKTAELLFNEKVKGIGIGFPAPVEHGRRIREANNMPGWKNVDLKKIVERKFSVPCRVENDAKCFVLAEHMFGAGKNRRNVVGITLGTGVGMGIIIDGKLYSGNSGAAGEISLIPYEGDKIERIASTHFFKRYGVDSADVYSKLQQGNPKTQKIICSYAKNLAIILSIPINVLDPEIIILGGGISNLLPYFKRPLIHELQKYCHPEPYSNLTIVKSHIKNAGVLGAALLFSHE
jgi:glucokinase